MPCVSITGAAWRQHCASSTPRGWLTCARCGGPLVGGRRLYRARKGRADETYVIMMERARQIVAEVTIDALSGAATIARLALHRGSRSRELDGLECRGEGAGPGDRIADVVVTMRPGTGLRADLMVVQKSKPLVTTVPASGAAPSAGLLAIWSVTTA